MTDTPDTPERLLTDLHLARLLSQAPMEAAARAITPADLWADIRRPAGTPVSFAVATALRDDPQVGAQYRQMLEALASAHSPVALAASDGTIDRNIGETTLKLLPPTEDGTPLLILTGPVGTALDMIGPDGETLRLDLPPADDGTIILALGPDMPNVETALTLLRDPGTALFLLP